MGGEVGMEPRAETQRIADLVGQAFAGEPWHGPSLMELLSDIDAEHAAARPVAAGHSIWEIVLHISAWERAALAGLRCGWAKLADDEDWPAIRGTDAGAWEATLTAAARANRALRAGIEQLDDGDLERVVTGSSSRYPLHVLLHGVLLHGLYHGGQIGLLKRASLGRSADPRAAAAPSSPLAVELMARSTTCNLRLPGGWWGG